MTSISRPAIGATTPPAHVSSLAEEQLYLVHRDGFSTWLQPADDYEPRAQLPDFPIVAVEHLAQLSFGLADPVETVRELDRLGVQGIRVMTTLARWPPQLGEVPPGGWYVGVTSDEWYARRDALLSEARARDMWVEISLFDDPERNEKHGVVRRAIEREGLDPFREGSFQGRSVSLSNAIDLAQRYLRGLSPDDWPNLIVRTTNEHHDWPDGYAAMPDEDLAEWLQGQGWTVARGAVDGEDRRSRFADIVSQHAGGDRSEPWPPKARMFELRGLNPGAKLVVSSDGFAVEDQLTPGELEEATGWSLFNGFSLYALVRTSPDQWPTRTREIVQGAVRACARCVVAGAQ